MDDEALHFPFHYSDEDLLLLAPYRQRPGASSSAFLTDWLAGLHQPGERIETYALLERISDRIHASLRYQRREEPGVQTPESTLAGGSGSCRDFATLFMGAARQLGFAARFVSGYLHDPAAWAAGPPTPGQRFTCPVRAGKASTPPSALSPSLTTWP